MALIICEKCGELISDKAKKCPYCEKNRELFYERLVYVIWFTIIIVLFVCGYIL